MKFLNEEVAAEKAEDFVKRIGNSRGDIAQKIQMLIKIRAQFHDDKDVQFLCNTLLTQLYDLKADGKKTIDSKDELHIDDNLKEDWDDDDFDDEYDNSPVLLIIHAGDTEPEEIICGGWQLEDEKEALEEMTDEEREEDNIIGYIGLDRLNGRVLPTDDEPIMFKTDAPSLEFAKKVISDYINENGELDESLEEDLADKSQQPYYDAIKEVVNGHKTAANIVFDWYKDDIEGFESAEDFKDYVKQDLTMTKLWDVKDNPRHYLNGYGDNPENVYNKFLTVCAALGIDDGDDIEEGWNPLKDAQEEHKKKQKGLSPFMNINAGNVEANNKFFNHVNGADNCENGDCNGVAESLKPGDKFNLRDALNEIDKSIDNPCFVTLYDAAKLTDEDRVKLANMISGQQDLNAIYEFLAEKSSIEE